MKLRNVLGILALVSLVAVTALAAAPQAEPASETAAVEAPAPDLFAPEAEPMQSNPGCQGEPDDDCVCPAVYDPVCGCNGVTYSNDCYARCDGVRRWTDGECS